MVGLIQPITLYLWLVKSVNLYLGDLLIDESLVLPFYLWFFVCSTFPLFLFPWVGDFVWCFSHFPLFYVLCLCSRFMFCGYHEDFVKCLINDGLFPALFAYNDSVLLFFSFYIFFCCHKSSLSMLWVYFKLEVATVNFLLCFPLNPLCCT